jgi:hypothetical protein
LLEIIWAFRPMDYKYKTMFKFKRIRKKLIDNWDVKIEKKNLRGLIL